MISAYQSEAREKVSGYLRGSASLADLESWIWSFLGDLEESQDDGARNIAGTIGSLISEYSYGDRTEESMRKELATAILRPFEPAIQYLRCDYSSARRRSASATSSAGYKGTDMRRSQASNYLSLNHVVAQSSI